MWAGPAGLYGSARESEKITSVSDGGDQANGQKMVPNDAWRVWCKLQPECRSSIKPQCNRRRAVCARGRGGGGGDAQWWKKYSNVVLKEKCQCCNIEIQVKVRNPKGTHCAECLKFSNVYKLLDLRYLLCFAGTAVLSIHTSTPHFQLSIYSFSIYASFELILYS